MFFFYQIFKRDFPLAAAPYAPGCVYGSVANNSLAKGIVCIHSDQGFHYTSYRFIQLLKDHALRQSMSRRGNCWDNAPQESFFGHMKDEIDLSGCTAFEQVRAILDDWIDYYNNDRYQWQLAKLSPNEFYTYLTTGVYPLQGKPPVHDE